MAVSYTHLFDSPDEQALERVLPILRDEYDNVEKVGVLRTDEAGNEVEGESNIMLTLTGAFSADELKRYCAKFNVLAEAEGVVFRSFDCYGAPVELPDWFDEDGAFWHMCHLMDCGVPENTPCLFVFGMESNDRSTLDALNERFGNAGFRYDDMEAVDGGLLLTVIIDGRFNEAELRERYQQAAAIVAESDAELNGMIFVPPEAESES